MPSKEKWYPRSRKATMRRFLRQNGLPNVTDTMVLTRILRRHPVLLQETESEKRAKILKEAGIEGGALPSAQALQDLKTLLGRARAQKVTSPTNTAASSSETETTNEPRNT